MNVAGFELWGPVLAGLGGVALWFLVTYFDPNDDRVTGIFADVYRHSRTLVIVLIAYGLAVVMGYEVEGKITFTGCIGLGYAAQAGFEKLLAISKGAKPPRGDV